MLTNYPLPRTVDEKLFKLLIESVKEYAILMINPNGYIMSWNLGAENMTGFNETEIIGQHLSSFYTQEGRQKNDLFYYLEQALSNGSYEAECWYLRKNKSLFWANVVFTPLHDSYAQLIGFATVIRDSTAQRLLDEQRAKQQVDLKKKVRAQTAKVTANEVRFRKLIENSYEGISLLNENFHVFFRSLSAERINGWSDDARSTFAMGDLLHPDDVAEMQKTAEKVLANPGLPVPVTLRSKHGQGHYIWLECVFTNMLHEQNIRAIVSNFRDVTDKKAADAEILKKTEQIENILDRITDGFIALDNNFCYTYANKKIEEMLGRNTGLLIGKNVWDIFPDAVGSATYYAFQRAFKEQQYTANEDYYAPLHLWQENNIYPSPVGLSVFIRDITQRKLADLQLQQQYALLQEAIATKNAILNAVPFQIALIDEKGCILSVNRAWKNFVENNKLPIAHYDIGSGYFNVVAQIVGANTDYYHKIANGVKSVTTGGKVFFTTEYPCNLFKDKKWYQLVAASSANGQKNGAVVLHIDITDRKIAGESLLRSEANLRSVFENIDLSIVLFDTDLHVVSFNSNAKALSLHHFGKNLRKGTSAFHYFPAGRGALISQILERVKNGEVVSYETFYELNNAVEWFDVKWIGVENDEKEIVGVILTFKDITAKKNLDKERSKITADLVQRNKDLEQFAYIISHNLRAPVANIIGLADMLGGVETGLAAEPEILGALSKSVNNLDNVITDMNHILQVGSQVNDKRERVNLSLLVKEVEAGISTMISSEQAAIVCDFTEIDELLVLKSYLYSVFQNLIVNSIKYRQAGISPLIEIKSGIKAGMVAISFRDNGKGIDLVKNGQHLFGMYKRFDPLVEGKGMGLFMVRTQIESLGGRINVESKINEGTCFMIELPVEVKDADM